MSEPYDVTNDDDRARGLRRYVDRTGREWTEPAEDEIARLKDVIARIWALTVPRADPGLVQRLSTGDHGASMLISQLARIRSIAADESYRGLKEIQTR